MRAILEPGQVTEIRALEATLGGDFRQTLSGYFDDVEALVAQVSRIKAAKAIYFVPNEVNPVLLARAVNKIRGIKKEPTTGDHDITRRRWILLDMDAVRPADISSTDVEHSAAIARANKIAADLTDLHGWPEPIIGDSGNGAHLMYAVSLPAQDDGLLQRLLAALNLKYGDAVVKVDEAVFNPARIWKLYGTPACKGDSASSDRPHRAAKLLSIPPRPFALVTEEQIRLLTDELSPAAPVSTSPTAPRNGNARRIEDARIDLDAWLRKHSIEFDGPHDYQGGKKYELKSCPWNDSHIGSAVAIQFASGALSFRCLHDSCKANDWRALRDRFEPAKPRDASWRRTDVVVSDAGHEHAAVEQDESEERSDPQTPRSGKRIPAPINFLQLEFENSVMHEPVIDGLVRAGETFNVIASSKRGKTWFEYMMALSIASGFHFLGIFAVKRGRVLIIDNELHPPTIADRLNKVAAALNLSPDDWKPYLDIVPIRGSNVTIDHLRAYFSSVPKNVYTLIILDAFYKFTPEGKNENSNADMTWMYGLVDAYAIQTGATIALIHHASKGVQGNKSITDVGSGAGAQSRAADAHVVLRDHEEEECVVMQAEVRTFKRPAPVCLRWDYPVWRVDSTLDPDKLKRENGHGRRSKDDTTGEQPEPWTPERFAKSFITEEFKDKDLVEALAAEQGLSVRDTSNLITRAIHQGLFYKHHITRRHTTGGSRAVSYSTVKPDLFTTQEVGAGRPMNQKQSEKFASLFTSHYPGKVTDKQSERIRAAARHYDFLSAMKLMENHFSEHQDADAEMFIAHLNKNHS